MAKFFFSLLFMISSFAICLATETKVKTDVESVTVYHSGALVLRSGSIQLKPGINELVFENLSSKIVLNSLKVTNKEVTVLNKSLLRKISKEDYKQLMDKKEALNKQLLLIESKFTEEGFVKDVEELESIITFYSERILATKKDLRAVEQQINDANLLQNIKLNNDDAAILKLTISLESPLIAPLKLQYVCGGIGWSPAYDINVASPGNKTIKFKYLAKIMSQTGEDWNDVTVHLSSSFPLESPTSLPKPDRPWVLRGDNNYNFRPRTFEQQQRSSKKQEIEQLKGVEYVELKVPSYLKLRTLKDKYSIQSNKTVFTFPILTVDLPCKYHYYGYPNKDPEVYLVAEVFDWESIGFVDGIANITFAGNDIGKSVIAFSESKDTLMLSVGRDNSVYMKRSEIADQKYFKITTIGKKRKITYAYQIELKNNNDFPIDFELVELTPISQTKAAEVEIEHVSGAQLDKENGIVSWQLNLAAGNSSKKKLIYRIDMDANYTHYSQRQKAKYKSISTPRF